GLRIVPWRHRHVVERVLQQVDTAHSDVTQPQPRLPEDLPLEREVELTRLGHFETGADECEPRDAPGDRPGNELKAVRRIRKIVGTGSGHLREIAGELIERCVRRIETDVSAALREDRLEYAAVRDAVAAANGKLTAAAGQRAQETVAVPVGCVRESNARVEVVARVVLVIDFVILFLRSADPLVSETEVQRETVERPPVVLTVCVRLPDVVLQVERAVTFPVLLRAAGHEGGHSASVIRAVAHRAERPEAARVVIRYVVEVTFAQIGPELERVLLPMR